LLIKGRAGPKQVGTLYLFIKLERRKERGKSKRDPSERVFESQHKLTSTTHRNERVLEIMFHGGTRTVRGGGSQTGSGT